MLIIDAFIKKSIKKKISNGKTKIFGVKKKRTIALFDVWYFMVFIKYFNINLKRSGGNK